MAAAAAVEWKALTPASRKRKSSSIEKAAFFMVIFSLVF
jgi:hypothetical protein